jgi:hypothetical protein
LSDSFVARFVSKILFSGGFIFLFAYSSSAQFIPVGSLVEETLRSMQLMGKSDSSVSFALRPFVNNQSTSIQKAYSFIASDSNQTYQKPFHFAGKTGWFSILPVSFIQQFNTHHPYGWNDGSMISAKGYQTLFSAGVYASLGPLEVQLQPEVVFAANPVFEGNSLYGSNTLKSYSKILPGQSSIRLSAGSVSIGLSSENLWWGPGIHSSLLMSNNATGFAHLFFKSRRPVSTPIGSFEWQLIGGKLLADDNLPYENKNLTTASLPKDWRYLSAMVISYHPKWVPGLFLGFTRAIQQYESDMNLGSPGFFEKYIPVIALAIQKKNVQNDDNKKRDQLASFFLRWLLAKANAEFYVEYGFNDYGVNVRDYVMAPTHSAAYIAGVKKIVPLQKPLTRLELGFEITQMSQSPDYLVRNAGNWYEHSQVLQGYTNNNQIMGAGAGFGANVQSLTATWVQGWKQLGFLIERVERDPLNHVNHWLDLGIGVLPQWKYKNVIFSGKLQFINSSNYAWEKEVNRFNVHSRLSIQYLL